MDETYEFITPDSPNAELNPLYVFQDDGTILITQVEEGKENVEPCAVFQVASNQYFVDANSTTPLITVPDQFATPPNENNVIGYLLQPSIETVPTEVTEDMDTDPLETKPELMKATLETTTIKPVNSNFTEITLNNEQYQMLEQKGWILLECNEKIFVLNTLGLHDITDNKKLILKLKGESEEYNENRVEPSTSKVQIECNPFTQDKEEDDEAQELDVEESIDEPSEVKPMPVVLDVENTVEDENNVSNAPRDTNPKLQLIDNTESISIEHYTEKSTAPAPETTHKRSCDTLKIKTKHIFTDIPPKIYLGKTANGKKLFAKITNTKQKGGNKEYKDLCVFNGKKIEGNSTLTESQFINLAQESVRGAPQLAAAEAQLIMAQLLNIPEIRDSTVGNKLIMTKMSLSTNAQGKTMNEKKPMIITGIVKETENNQVKFLTVPKMLQTLSSLDNTKKPIQHKSKDVIEIFHLHVLESTEDGKPPNQTIHLSKRKLSLEVIRDTKKRHPDPVYACGACAAVFHTEPALKDHQESQCFADDALTIDTDTQKDYDSYYTVVDTGTKKLYSCRQCGLRFARLFNCRSHTKTHDMSLYQNCDSEGDKQSQREVYKCTMCSSTYFHPSSLSKHILKMHIQV